MDLYRELRDVREFFLIAGPCVVEETSVMEEVAAQLVKIRDRFHIPVVFKASYKKANRSSGNSPTGPGLDAGLRALEDIKKQFGLPLLTDVHESTDVTAVSEVCDILQIPAFLCRQTELIRAAGDTGKIVNIKKGQFLAAEDMCLAAQKTGENHKVLLTERGTSFGYHNLVVDFRGFAIMSEFGYPVVYDVTHSMQLPSIGSSSGGTPQFAPLMAQAAIATGKVQGLFLEVHPSPEKASSDSASMLRLDRLEMLITDCIRIAQITKGG